MPPCLGDRADATNRQPGDPGEAVIGDLQDPLTPRELEVLRALAEGTRTTNKAIAFDPGISEHTVNYHVGSLLIKHDASGRTEAVTVGGRMGLFSL
ncbi:MAG: helix-turn-helix transcriptional regulator [Dehalococcoidia bacterium]|nr:helix-turn-helix transcriptional regulator [Dehalococcoidia bacterium]